MNLIETQIAWRRHPSQSGQIIFGTLKLNPETLSMIEQTPEALSRKDAGANCGCSATNGIVRTKPARAIMARLLEEIRGEVRRG
jgi:hypothetical protein